MDEIANVEMANAWDGEEGDQWTEFADNYDEGMRSIWARFLAANLIATGDRVLDIGCGNGQSSRDAAVRPGVRRGDERRTLSADILVTAA